MHRALSLLGALVLLLLGQASAQEIDIYNVRRATIIEMFKVMSDDDAVKFLRAADNGSTLKVNVRVPVFLSSSRDVEIDLNQASNLWRLMTAQYTNANINIWNAWLQDVKPKFGAFAYPVGGVMIEDGTCKIPPGASYGGINLNTTTGLKIMKFESYSVDLGWTKRYNSQVLAGGQSFGPGESYNANQDPAPFVALCFKDTAFSTYPYSPFNGGTNNMTPAQFLGEALRGVAKAYYSEQPSPSYAGYTIVGISETSLEAACTSSTCPAAYVPPPSGGGSTPPPTGGTGGTAPACTTSTGTTSGNPYDCVPSNSETKCGIIDIPCNLKKLFIPDKNFVQDKVKNSSFGVNVNIPVSIVNKWCTDIKLASFSSTMPICLDFTGLTLDEKGKDQWRFMVFWGTFLWLLSFLGVPFLGTRQSVGDAGKDAVVGAAERSAAKSASINSEYEKLRADDSWKS